MEIEEDEDLTLTVVTEVEDKEIKEKLKDIREDSESNKTPASRRHFNDFLKILCEEQGAPVTTIEEIPYRGLGEAEKLQAWWDDCLGKFFTYLTFQAHKYFNPKNDFISQESAVGYASAIKSYLENIRFRNRDPLNVLDENGRWRKLRNEMKKNFNSRSRQTGKRVVNPRVGTSKEDRVAMSKACCWTGSTETAEFLLLNVWALHLLARGREISFLKTSDIGSADAADQEIEHEVLDVNMQRDKTGLVQDLILYPHKHDIQHDPHFALLYRILVLGFQDELFPNFIKEARMVDKNNKNKSRIQALWERHFLRIVKEFQHLSESSEKRLTQLLSLKDKGLTSYSSRKGGNQDLCEMTGVSGPSQIYRTGWESPNAHSLMDYIIGTKTLTNQAGKVSSTPQILISL